MSARDRGGSVGDSDSMGDDSIGDDDDGTRPISATSRYSLRGGGDAPAATALGWRRSSPSENVLAVIAVPLPTTLSTHSSSRSTCA